MPAIRKASSVQEGALRRFYADAFPDRGEFLAKHWEWLYRVGRFPGIDPLVLVEGERVVGHAGAIPVKLAREGKAETAIWFVDFSILPDFQGKGHGKTLTEAWMALCPRRITFCNDLSMRLFLKAGWTERSDASVRSLPLELSGPLRRRFGPLAAPAGPVMSLAARSLLKTLTLVAPRAETKALPPDAEAISQRLDDASAPIRVVRDADWVRWRLLENPRRDEHVLAEAGGVSAIFRLFNSLGRRRAHLLHVGPGPAPARAEMVKAFARWALENGADDLWMAGNDSALLAAAACLLPRSRPLRYAWHGADAAAAALLSAPLPTQGIDSDHDLMFP
jgi:GNAT superfamily N-acetyltransferase